MNGCFSAIKRDEQRGERSCCKVCTTGWHREGAHRAPNLLFPAPALLVCSVSGPWVFRGWRKLGGLRILEGLTSCDHHVRKVDKGCTPTPKPNLGLQQDPVQACLLEGARGPQTCGMLAAAGGCWSASGPCGPNQSCDLFGLSLLLGISQ